MLPCLPLSVCGNWLVIFGWFGSSLFVVSLWSPLLKSFAFGLKTHVIPVFCQMITFFCHVWDFIRLTNFSMRFKVNSPVMGSSCTLLCVRCHCALLSSLTSMCHIPRSFVFKRKLETKPLLPYQGDKIVGYKALRQSLTNVELLYIKYYWHGFFVLKVCNFVSS